MSTIASLDLSSFKGYVDGNRLPATSFVSMVTAIETKTNELVTAVNNGTGGGGGGDTPAADAFYVNGTLTTPTSGVITLAAGSTYVLKGTLTGQVVIGTATEEPSADTQIVLDGVTISNALTDNSCISYLPESKQVNITLAKNTVNILVCSNVAAIADSQKGCIYCENNLFIQGNGYLACKNLGGHGIKASKLTFVGNPHCYAYSSHDAFHGNGRLDIFGGVYYVAKANDAFGTRAEEGTSGTDGYKAPGIIRLFKGEIYAYNLNTNCNVLDSKGNGYIFGEYGIHTDVAAAKVLSTTMKAIDPKVFFGAAVQDTTNGGYTTQPTGSVKCYTDEDMTQGEATITASSGTYTLTTKYCKISGYIDGNIAAPITSTDISVGGNVYVAGNIAYDNSAMNSGEPSKKICIKNPKDTEYICIVAGNYTSANNSAIEAANGAVTILKGNMQGDELTFTDTKGMVMIDGNVTGKDIYIGTDAKAQADNKLEGSLVVAGTMQAVLNSKFTKGWIHVLSTGLLGVFCADTIDAAGYADLNGSTHVFYHNAKGIVIGEKTTEDADYVAAE